LRQHLPPGNGSGHLDDLPEARRQALAPVARKRLPDSTKYAQARLLVASNLIGVAFASSPDKLSSLNAAFYIAASRAAPVQREAHALGGQYPLGIGRRPRKILSIHAQISQRHNGAIWLESQPGCGSACSFQIPLEHKEHRARYKESGYEQEDYDR
jgi:hypothetical protein